MPAATVTESRTAGIAVLILAGGEAKRLPGKLSLPAGGVPMLVHVYRNLSPGRHTFVSARATFPPEIDAQLDCPLIVDRWIGRGPLAGMLSAFEEIPEPFVFVAAGDAPLLRADFIDRLARARQTGDEAVVPTWEAGGTWQLEPLAALYDRAAFLREAPEVLHAGDGSVLAAIERLSTRFVTIDRVTARTLRSVNTPADYAEIAGSL